MRAACDVHAVRRSLGRDKIVGMGFDIIKVASCSARDWPLLEKIAASGLPVVARPAASAGRGRRPRQLLRSSRLRFRADALCLDLSDPRRRLQARRTSPNSGSAIRGAQSAGRPTSRRRKRRTWARRRARRGMFERHVGVETDRIKLNAYSSTPQQVDAGSPRRCGPGGSSARVGARSAAEVESAPIDELERGVFARRRSKPGRPIGDDQVYFAFPYRPGQLSSGEWKRGIVAKSAVTRRPARCW